MNWPVERSREARADLADIWNYIAEDNPAAADRQLDAIDSVFDLLSTHPKIGRLRDDIQVGLRGFTRGHYLVLYRIDESHETLQIVRIVHGMRNLAALFG